MVTFDPSSSSLADVCVENWPSLQPWQVAIACSIDQSDSSVESHDCGRSRLNVYANYLARLLGSCEGVREEVRCDDELVLASLEMVLRTGPPLHELLAEDTDGCPKSGSLITQVLV